jgi:hypothetical protein
MMKRKIHRYLFSTCGATLALAAGVLLSPAAAQAQTISETAKVGVYTVTLKVVVPPTNFFNGPNTMTVWKGVAVPSRVLGRMKCFLFAFITEKGKPVGHASVNITLRKLSPEAGPWTELAVVRWRGFVPVAQSLAETSQTTGFGNHVELLPGHYEARVTVNERGPTTFRFSLHSRSSQSKAR